LKQYTQTIFAAAGCSKTEAARVAECLVEANLVGHDSHGVIRIAASGNSASTILESSLEKYRLLPALREHEGQREKTYEV
jgi:hypothetical protein|tara:strand:- start:828 stop:1067 length:240 start_codon:yes stop_codon:yes gene_type:complete